MNSVRAGFTGVSLPIDQKTDLIGQANHVFVVRIMREPDKIASQFPGPAEQDCVVFDGKCAPTAERRLLMHGNTAEENGLAVEENFRAARFNGAKSNLILHAIACARKLHAVKLWIFW